MVLKFELVPSPSYQIFYIFNMLHCTKKIMILAQLWEWSGPDPMLTTATFKKSLLINNNISEIFVEKFVNK